MYHNFKHRCGRKELLNTDKGKCELLNKFFSSVFTRPSDDESIKSSDCNVFPSLTDVYFEPSMVEAKINNLKINSAGGPDMIDSKVLKAASDIISYPLAVLFNRSMQEGIVPQDWKDANICPIYKKGSKSSPNNYRPVSLTSLVCRVMEKSIKDQIVKFLEENVKISPHQHGFRKKKSCVTNLLEYMEKLTNLIDSGHAVDVIYFDYSKAFDSVCHSKLVHKLNTIGVQGNLNKWIAAWLSDRRQRVVMNGMYSTWAEVISGVPQGSVLGPILFIIFVDDISGGIKNFILLFADDLKLLSVVDNDEQSVCIQQDIDNLYQWATLWDMKFNSSKCSTMHFGKNNKNYDYTLGTEVLQSSEKEKDLGVIIQTNLKVDQQVKKVSQTCNRILSQIGRSFTCKEPELMLKIFKTYVLPHIDYGATVWSPHHKKDIKVIESIQRRFTRMIPCMQGLDYTERCAALGLTTLEQRRIRQDLIQCYRNLNHVDNIDHTMFKKVHEVHTKTRASLKENLVKEKSRLDSRRNFFSQRVVNHWNDLPQHVQCAKNLKQFKTMLDNYI